MDDRRFDRLYAAWRAAEDALEAHVRESDDALDPAVSRLVVQQLQKVALTRYGALCRHLEQERARLPLI